MAPQWRRLVASVSHTVLLMLLFPHIITTSTKNRVYRFDTCKSYISVLLGNHPENAETLSEVTDVLNAVRAIVTVLVKH